MDLKFGLNILCMLYLTLMICNRCYRCVAGYSLGVTTCHDTIQSVQWFSTQPIGIIGVHLKTIKRRNKNNRHSKKCNSRARRTKWCEMVSNGLGFTAFPSDNDRRFRQIDADGTPGTETGPSKASRQGNRLSQKKVMNFGGIMRTDLTGIFRSWAPVGRLSALHVTETRVVRSVVSMAAKKTRARMTRERDTTGAVRAFNS